MVSHSDCELYQAFDLCYDYDIYGDFLSYVQGKTELTDYVRALERQESIYPADYAKLRFLENHDRPRMAHLFPERRTRLNWLCWMFFQKGTALLYSGQEWENDHRPDLFDPDPIPMEGPAPLEGLIRRLTALKKDPLFEIGAYSLRACPGDVLTAVTRLTEKLKSGRLTPEEETLSLKMLIHLVGDMHCPMHLGRLSDLGGNKRPVRFFGRDTNLHSVWDTNIPEAVHKWSYSEWQQQIDRLTDEEAAQIAAGEPADWVKETHEICKEIYGFTPEGTDISYDYLFKYTPVVERQFLRGGHRLARLLNEIYR